MSIKPLTPGQLKSFRSDVARLKKAGLLSKHVDARSQRGTRYMRDQVKKYQDVLDGKAKVVKAPRNKDAKQYGEKYRTKFDRVVVPVRSEKASARYNRKTKQITIFDDENGKRIKKTLSPKVFTSVKDLPRGKNIGYRIIFGGGTSWTFDDVDDLQAFMQPYESKSKNPFKDWLRYVEIIELDLEGDED